MLCSLTKAGSTELASPINRWKGMFNPRHSCTHIVIPPYGHSFKGAHLPQTCFMPNNKTKQTKLAEIQRKTLNKGLCLEKEKWKKRAPMMILSVLPSTAVDGCSRHPLCYYLQLTICLCNHTSAWASRSIFHVLHHTHWISDNEQNKKYKKIIKLWILSPFIWSGETETQHVGLQHPSAKH